MSIPAHLAERWDGITLDEAQEEWRTTFRPTRWGAEEEDQGVELAQDSGDERCPYCQSTDDCRHLLLLVDKTFQSGQGGHLFEAFNKRWHAICDAGGDDFDGSDAFEDLIEEVYDLADDWVVGDCEGGPGASSAVVAFYVASGELNTQALEQFRSKVAK